MIAVMRVGDNSIQEVSLNMNIYTKEKIRRDKNMLR